MRLICLGSGSNGNAYVVSAEGSALIIDAGVPVTRLRGAIAEVQARGDVVRGVLISHEHSDHVSALSRLCRQLPDVPCFATAGTVDALRASGPDWTIVRPFDTLTLSALRVVTFPLSHDAADPIGFRVSGPDATFTIATDLGASTSDVEQACTEVDLLVIESNYDEQLLARGRYPAHLKRRIRGSRGHLSNDAAADFLERVLSGGTRHVWLAHLSAENNRPELALATASARLRGPLAPQLTALPRNGHRVVWDSELVRRTPRQLGLPLD